MPRAVEPFLFPSIYSFPPFFTRQLNETTWSTQKSHWITLILGYFRYHRRWRIDLNINELNDDELFHNKAINRKLKVEVLKEIIDDMVKQRSAEYVNSKKHGAWVYWRTPEEWADYLANWIDATGQKGAVLTMFELSQGELVVGSELEGIEPVILRKALEVLGKRGLAQLLKSADSETGVKFFAGT
ncbi:Vacuolar protein-sorting-associated protein 25 [Neolecta irregularis DAH-3]|uniref:ESCRT-II complex subunit VPS25 n=1 Tax=Neolecta irregularis (strain DAH-3) TaxID=1198029 RepID=A0A1U7LPK2_NEOID|nr:Vacuolar protein-sorting-associated protein 25 [Neolecta irregularis DAH-3]|eukprot:OLL24596.1 Vacuolar protein-sorting-associated protein 25 [Neolecta irregularis DAH-3]